MPPSILVTGSIRTNADQYSVHAIQRFTRVANMQGDESDYLVIA